VTTDVSVRNEQGQFVATLARGDFDVYEDNVKQEIVGFVLTHGGRVLTVSGPRATTQEGLLLPLVGPNAFSDLPDFPRRPQHRLSPDLRWCDL
jgi:hypothetical protein